MFHICKQGGGWPAGSNETKTNSAQFRFNWVLAELSLAILEFKQDSGKKSNGLLIIRTVSDIIINSAHFFLGNFHFTKFVYIDIY